MLMVCIVLFSPQSLLIFLHFCPFVTCLSFLLTVCLLLFLQRWSFACAGLCLLSAGPPLQLHMLRVHRFRLALCQVFIGPMCVCTLYTVYVGFQRLFLIFVCDLVWSLFWKETLAFTVTAALIKMQCVESGLLYIEALNCEFLNFTVDFLD